MPICRMAMPRFPVMLTLLVLSCHASSLKLRGPLPTIPRRGSHLAMVGMPALVGEAAAVYKRCLLSSPVATNCITSSALSVLSDGLAQRLERMGTAKKGAGDDVAKLKHKWDRSAWIALWGFCVSGYVVSCWFRVLNSLFPVGQPSLALPKVLVNQIVMSPSMTLMFFTFVTFTRGDASGESRVELLKRKIRRDLVATMSQSAIFWGVVQFINFLVIPASFQQLYTSVGFVIWTTYVAIVGYRKA